MCFFRISFPPKDVVILLPMTSVVRQDMGALHTSRYSGMKIPALLVQPIFFTMKFIIINGQVMVAILFQYLLFLMYVSVVAIMRCVTERAGLLGVIGVSVGVTFIVFGVFLYIYEAHHRRKFYGRIYVD